MSSTKMTSQTDPLFIAFQSALAGRYSIEHEIGRGGMGIVYLAREVHLDRLVAIKLLPPEKANDPGLRAHFVREARLAAKLSHPNIIPIHAVDENGEFVFYVMAFIDGETLGQRVQGRGPLTSSEAARVLREVAWALAHAHSHGLVHRDVKPDNILLESGTGRVLVADFGIASAEHETAEKGVGVGGSPEFMSPEQALGQTVDPRSDIYGLGITAYYALSGRLPFEASTPVALLAMQVTATAPPLASTGLPVSRKIAQLVERCMEKDPARRPASADAVAEQLSATIEQRREVPPALRVFVKQTSRMNRGGVLPLVVLYGVQAFIAATFGVEAAVTTFFAGTAAVSFGYLTYAARQIMKLGFRHEDVEPAFSAQLEQSREESAVEHRGGKSLLEKILLRLTRATGAILLLGMAVSVVGNTFHLWVFPGRVLTMMLGVGSLVFPFGIGYLHVLDLRVDVDTEFWAKVWRGRIGRAAFWLGRKLLGRQQPVMAGTHRATELALGMAAESLFEGLPAPTRKALGDLPALVRRLERDAQKLRALYDQVQDALAGARDAEFTEAHTDLMAHRDRIHARLGEAVAALEMIRLNLLRLHAGVGTVESLTTNIDMAEDVSAEVERLLAARQEVERALLFPFPRETAMTPT
jgi:eukaryotic-like serine/threonine-protein kinase